MASLKISEDKLAELIYKQSNIYIHNEHNTAEFIAQRLIQDYIDKVTTNRSLLKQLGLLNPNLNNELKYVIRYLKAYNKRCTTLTNKIVDLINIAACDKIL